ncbi:GspH/FimT family pseudopilin [bacterium]|nr:GspH/FimT family pseudopilin [bacterium]MCI0601857.1 GspH/FimT family pseudopilin [bacterium]
MNRLEHGYTLLEALSIVAIFGFVAALSLPQGIAILQTYKLKAGTQQVATAIQFTRAKAVSENFQCTFSNFLSSGVQKFQITGGEDDHNDGLNPWEDRNGNGVEDTITFIPQELPTGVKVVSTLNGISAVPVTGNPTSSTSSLVFTPLGVPKLSNAAAAIYLQNQKSENMAITVDLSGRVQTWKHSGTSWVAM